jgi:hypothetical protein
MTRMKTLKMNIIKLKPDMEDLKISYCIYLFGNVINIRNNLLLSKEENVEVEQLLLCLQKMSQELKIRWRRENIN